MMHLNKKKKNNNTIVTAATLFTLATIIIGIPGAATILIGIN
jgi:hypothetical protein